MIERNELSVDIRRFIRPTVLDDKPIMGRDEGAGDKFNCPMTKTEHRQLFIARVIEARRRRFETQQDLCDVLDIPQPKYSKYETRSYMPHDLIPRFIKATGVTYEWLYDLRQASQSTTPLARKMQRRQRKRRRVAAA